MLRYCHGLCDCETSRRAPPSHNPPSRAETVSKECSKLLMVTSNAQHDKPLCHARGGHVLAYLSQVDGFSIANRYERSSFSLLPVYLIQTVVRPDRSGYVAPSIDDAQYMTAVGQIGAPRVTGVMSAYATGGALTAGLCPAGCALLKIPLRLGGFHFNRGYYVGILQNAMGGRCCSSYQSPFPMAQFPKSSRLTFSCLKHPR